MSEWANQQFLNDPPAFLAANVVIMAWGNLPDGGATAGRYDFDLQEVPGHIPRVFRLIGAGAMNNDVPIHAHWVPYVAGEYMENDAIDADADIILTARMNGCTFVVGNGDNPLVAHINHVSGAAIDQAAIDHDTTTHFPDGTRYELTQADYQVQPGGGINGAFNYTVVGYRPLGASGFTFEMQQYTFMPASGVPATVASATLDDLAARGSAAFGVPVGGPPIVAPVVGGGAPVGGGGHGGNPLMHVVHRVGDGVAAFGRRLFRR